jgi:anhydro-N-acetylmuramic acid kinase
MQNSESPAATYIGLMSGTSMDGIDSVLVQFPDQASHECEILESHHQGYPAALREELTICSRDPESLSIDTLGSLDQRVASCLADAACTLLDKAGTDNTQVTAIGSHGQTMRHRPDADPPFTVQIGDPNLIAARTGITTVADFRRRDMALGGQGAPLAPAFHEWLFSHAQEHRVVLNIGGIANVTILQGGTGATTGFDTGPGNTLLDAWINKNRSEAFDASGSWAGSGQPVQDLLQRLMNDPYIDVTPPKSTGFEYFDLHWLEQHINQCNFSPSPTARDIQATLAEFTARSIAHAIKHNAAKTEQIFACGGGVHNDDLMARLRRNMQGVKLSTTAEAGLDPDWVEAAAFAWLAMRTLKGLPGNLPAVTGAHCPAVLGAVFYGNNAD